MDVYSKRRSRPPPFWRTSLADRKRWTRSGWFAGHRPRVLGLGKSRWVQSRSGLGARPPPSAVARRNITATASSQLRHSLPRGRCRPLVSVDRNEARTLGLQLAVRHPVGTARCHQGQMGASGPSAGHWSAAPHRCLRGSRRAGLPDLRARFEFERVSQAQLEVPAVRK